MSADHITAAVTTCANGSVLPTYIIFKDSFPATRFDENVDNTWVFAVNDTGHMTSDLMVQYLEKCFLPNIGNDRPILLFMDQHSSHMTPAIIETAIANKIELFCYPSNCTHMLQPFDQSFRTLIESVAKIAISLKLINPALHIDKYKFPVVLQYAISVALSKKNVKSSWSITGNWPINPDVMFMAEYLASVTKPGDNGKSNHFEF